METSAFPAELIRRLQEAHHIVALTGAGISAESGIPTFREAQTGLWARYDPQTLASPEALARNPGLVWSWYAWRRSLVRQAAPNAGHRALAAMERLVPRFTLVTQNVDGLHQQAGSRTVIELHGNIMRTVCAAQRHVVTQWAPVPEGEAPTCPYCGSVLRPDVVFFGENLPPRRWKRPSRQPTPPTSCWSLARRGWFTLPRPCRAWQKNTARGLSKSIPSPPRFPTWPTPPCAHRQAKHSPRW